MLRRLLYFFAEVVSLIADVRQRRAAAADRRHSLAAPAAPDGPQHPRCRCVFELRGQRPTADDMRWLRKEILRNG